MASIADVLAKKSRATLSVTLKLAADEDVTFTFEALPKVEFRDLLNAHRPTKAQQQDYKRQAAAMGVLPHKAGELTYNPDTFPPALFAACCASHPMDIEEATALWTAENFSTGELEALLGCAIAVQSKAPQAPDPEA